MLMKEGHNCWKIEKATRIRFLVDSDSYFSALYDTIINAQKSVFIIGWDIHSRLLLRRDDGDYKYPIRLGDFLNAMTDEKPELHIYILSWDFAMIYLFERETFPVFQLDWKTHKRVRFHMDNHHPAGASQHQKIVVIDDTVAFAGGIDLGTMRWDTSAHIPDDSRRVDPDGNYYQPFHDTQVMLEGNAARRMAELARERWKRATGEVLAASEIKGTPWPDNIQPDLMNTEISISRTYPLYKEYPEVREIEQFYRDAILSARDVIYIENQYFTSSMIGELLRNRLQEENGPEIVIIGPLKMAGWMEETTMGLMRSKLLKTLRETDTCNRLKVMYPVASDGRTLINVHAKIIIIDNTLLHVGSANLSNRSMGFDSECDVTLEAIDDEKISSFISNFRNTLLAEHLDVSISDINKALQNKQSLIKTIESYTEGGKTLKNLESEIPPILTTITPDVNLVDPEKPIDPEILAKRILPVTIDKKRIFPLLKIITGIIILAGLAAAWKWTPLQQVLQPSVIIDFTQPFINSSWAPFAVAGLFTAGSIVMIPITAMIIATSLLFGAVSGFLYSMAGAVLASIVTYIIGLLLWRDALRQLAGKRLNNLSGKLGKQSILVIAILRMVPVAPFTIVNIAAGSAKIKFSVFVTGTILGMIPGTLAITVFSDSLLKMITNPAIETVLTTIGIVIFMIVGSI
ncbi:MAG: VTT domain-containing protein, partial [Spirochaetota bacterium]